MSEEPELAVYAASIHLGLPCPSGRERWEVDTAAFFSEMADGCRMAGAAVIGHLKGFMDFGEAGYLYFSHVGGSRTESRGEGDGLVAVARLDFNVLVFGLPEDRVRTIAVTSAARLAERIGAARTMYEPGSSNNACGAER